jgi:hypothetical protein
MSTNGSKTGSGSTRQESERAGAPESTPGPPSSPASVRSDDTLNIAELRTGLYDRRDVERALAPIVHDLATPQFVTNVNRAEQLMKLLYLMEHSSRENLLAICEVAQAHAYTYTEECERQRSAHLRGLVRQSFAGSEDRGAEVDEREWEQTEREPYSRLKWQEKIMAELMIDTTPDEVILAVREVLSALLGGQTQPGQAAVEG